MPAGSLAGSSVTYSKVCSAGQSISGYAELTGTNYGADWSYAWTLQILGPGGESILDWQGHYVNSPRKDFSIVASYAGTYTIRVSHVSTYPKNLTISVSPPGWGYGGAAAYVPPSLTVSPSPTSGTPSAPSPTTGLLSERETEVLWLVAEGLSNQQIASKLTVSLSTAKTHVHRLFEKLNAKDRLQAVTRARELKLI